MFICLISPDFLASPYCYDKELRWALDKHAFGQLFVLPVILRHCTWQLSPLSRIQVLPPEGRPISAWPDRDEAWNSVIKGILGISEIFQKESETLWPAELKPFSIAAIGNYGDGKATIGNILLGGEFSRVEHFLSVTPTTQKIAGQIGGLPVYWIEPPPLCDLIENDYRRSEFIGILTQIDLIILIHSAPDSRMAPSERKLLERDVLQRFDERMIFVLNRIDEIPPRHEWNSIENCPGPTQRERIAQCVAFWAGSLNLSVNKVIPISTDCGYNLDSVRVKIQQMAKLATARESR